MPAKTTARKRGPKPRPRLPVPNTAPFITRLPWTLNEMEVELAERSLRDFLAQAWHVVEPGVEFIPGWHLDAVCDHLQAVTEGYIRNLLILMPPRHSKSTIASVMWPAWEWIRHASRKWLFSSYSSDLAIRDSVKCRRLIQSEWYQSRWGHIYRLTGDQNAKERYENTRGGVRLATSVGGTATGEGGDRIVCLAGETRIVTDRGRLPIKDIVEQRLPVRVLGLAHGSGKLVWQSIEAYEHNPGRPSSGITFSDGSRITATNDHPVFLPATGCYYPVSRITHGDYVLRCLPQACSKTCRPQAEAGLLRSQVSGYMAAWREQPTMARRECYSQVQSVWENIYEQAQRGRTLCMLLPAVSGCMASWLSQVWGSALRKLRNVWETRSGSTPPFAGPRVLLTHLRQSSPTRTYARPQQSSILHRAVVLGVPLRVYQGVQGPDSQKGSGSLRDMQTESSPSGSPHRRNEGESLPGKLSDTVHELSPHSTYEEGHQFTLDEDVRVAAVQSCPTPATVYNIRTSTGNYFAEGILVHNCDDPHNVKHAESEAIRTATIQWWDQVMSTRTNDPKKSAKVIIMQRSHDSDLAGHLMRSGLYETLLLPAEYEPARRCVTSIGFEDPRKEEGELLHPDRFGEEQIKILKIELGAYGTAAQLQQRPTPKEGGIIKNTWWRYYEKLPDKFDEILQSWDCAFKDLRSSDYVAGQLWGRVGADCYLLHQLRGQYSFTKTQSQVVALSDIAMDTYKAPRSHAKLVEDKANGTAVIDSLKSAVPGLIAVNPEGGKVARLAAVSPMIESGNVYLPRPENCPWVTDYLLEFEYFPYGTHDDQVDATSQALLRLMRHRKRSGMAPIVSTTRSASFPSMSAAQVNPVTGTTQNRYAPVWSGR